MALISINAVFGENGLVARTEMASEKHKYATAKEEVTIGYLDAKSGKTLEEYEETVAQKLEEILQKEDENASVTEVIFGLDVYYKNYNFEIDDNGEITGTEDIQDGIKIIKIGTFGYDHGIYWIDSNGGLGIRTFEEETMTIDLPVRIVPEECTSEYVTGISGRVIKYEDDYAFDNKGKIYIIQDRIATCINQDTPIFNIKQYYDGLILGGDGKVYTWGNNEYGQLGVGNTENSENIICISDQAGNILNGKKISKIYEDYNSRMAIDTEGNLYAWGYNTFGNLGNGTEENALSPFCVTDVIGSELQGKKIQDVGLDSVAVILDKEGNVYTCGWTDRGELGNCVENQRESLWPINITNISTSPLYNKKIIKLYTYIQQHFVIDNQGKLYAWGASYDGELGNGEEDWSIETPICINNQSESMKDAKIVDIYLANSTAFAIDAQGKVYSWGSNYDSRLGIGSTDTSIIGLPTCISDISGSALNGAKIKEFVKPDYYHRESIIVIDDNNNVYGWGPNQGRQLGNTAKVPLPICLNKATYSELNGKNILKVYHTDDSFLAYIDSEKNVYTCGSNSYGQLGVGDIGYTTDPICINNVEDSPLYQKKIKYYAINGTCSLISTLITEDGEGFYFGGYPISS